MKNTFLFLGFIFSSAVFAEAPLQAPSPADAQVVPVVNQAETNLVTPVSQPVTAQQLLQPISAPQHEIKPVTVALQPHQAEYTISLDKNKNGTVVDVKGVLTVKLIDTGDGWAFEQHSVLHVYDNEGFSTQYLTTIASWESKDGQRYRFNVRSLRNGVEEDTIRGSASIYPNAEGTVVYEAPSGLKAVLPVGTLFPLQHLHQTLTAAMAGERVFANKIIFDGSSDTHEPVDVNVIINPIQKPKVVVDNPDLLSVDKAWSLQMAIFPRGSRNVDPDYEITQTVLPSGIITSMNMGYGEAGFSTKLTLQKVNIFPAA